MTTTTETEALYDMDGNCICKMDICAFCNPSCELCEGLHDLSNCDKHSCTGDNCYCIGGDENLDLAAAYGEWRMAQLGDI